MRAVLCVKNWLVCAVALALTIGLASTASAQPEKRLGVFLGFPTTAGVQWQINDRLALRGDAGFDWGRVEQVIGRTTLSIVGLPGFGSTTTTTTNFKHSNATVGLSGLITVSHREQLRLYLAPRIAWRHLRSSFSSESVTTGSQGVVASGLSDLSDSSTTNGIELDAMFGANYRLGDRFSVYGEAGIDYTSPTSTSSSDSDALTSYRIGSRTNIGVVIHF